MTQGVALFLGVSLTASAIETDQFRAALVPLKDAAPVVNDYITDKMDKALSNINKDLPKKITSKSLLKSCQKLADETFDRILGFPKISAISNFAETSELVDRFPDASVSMKDYMSDSIYSNAKFPINMVGLSHIIRIGNVYIGTDKLGHFSLLGRNYYHRYLRHLDRSKNQEQAIIKTIKKGIHHEIVYLGYALGGVLSFADLEANYQGLLFGIELCEGNNPYYIFESGKWTTNPKRTFDIKNYIGPKTDETFNPNLWRPGLWEKIGDDIKQAYCPLFKEPVFQERMANYEANAVTTINDLVIEDYVQKNPKYDRKKQLNPDICN